MSRAIRGLCMALVVLAILSPLGLILPEIAGAGAAWGEWSAGEVQELVGYVPQGLARLGELWRAPLPDYALPGQDGAPLPALSLSYILSALIGTAVVVGVTVLIGRLLVSRERTSDAS